MIVFLYRSVNPKKKWTVEFLSGAKVNFGDSAYEDYTIHRDPVRKQRYIARHIGDNLRDLGGAGFWARYLLWNKPTIEEAIKDIQQKFNITVKVGHPSRVINNYFGG